MSVVACPECGTTIPKSISTCPSCGAKRTHQDCYPEQYNHPAVGKTFRTKEGLEGKAERVVPSRFGVMVYLEGAPEDTVYRLADLEEVQVDDSTAEEARASH